MMHQKGGYLYYEGDGFQALDLPYKGEQLSMLVVLPRKKDGLAALESQMGRWKQTYRQVTDGLRPRRNGHRLAPPLQDGDGVQAEARVVRPGMLNWPSATMPISVASGMSR